MTGFIVAVWSVVNCKGKTIESFPFVDKESAMKRVAELNSLNEGKGSLTKNEHFLKLEKVPCYE